MATQPDDLQAVRTLISTLEAFPEADQQRIIRWTMEKLGLATKNVLSKPAGKETIVPTAGGAQVPARSARGRDIKSFVEEKAPPSDMQFAVTVAYYYQFEAGESERKDSITAKDLQDAARKAKRHRLRNPGQTLRNARYNGYLDSADERGAFKVDTVGENLVAMALPPSTDSSRPSRKKVKRKTSK